MIMMNVMRRLLQDANHMGPLVDSFSSCSSSSYSFHSFSPYHHCHYDYYYQQKRPGDGSSVVLLERSEKGKGALPVVSLGGHQEEEEEEGVMAYIMEEMNQDLFLEFMALVGV